MKILIIRTDKLGDFYVSLPFINSLSRSYGKSNIDIIVSKSIYKHFSFKNYLFNNIYSFPNKNIFKQISFIFNLRKIKYDKIIVFDGKDRSLFLTFFLKSFLNLVLIEKRKINFLVNLIFSKKKFKFFINNKIDSYHSMYKKIITYCDVSYESKDNKFLKKNDLFSISYLNDYKSNIVNYSQIHLDEKWFLNFYIKNYTNIEPTEKDFINFINNIIKIKKNSLIITTGIINLPFIENFKNNYFTKVNENLYKYNLNKNILLVIKSSINDLEIISMNADIIITCNGPLSQIACSHDINVIDILEKKLEFWYDRHISNKKYYDKLFRKNFIELSNEILNKIK